MYNHVDKMILILGFSFLLPCAWIKLMLVWSVSVIISMDNQYLQLFSMIDSAIFRFLIKF